MTASPPLSLFQAMSLGGANGDTGATGRRSAKSKETWGGSGTNGLILVDSRMFHSFFTEDADDSDSESEDSATGRRGRHGHRRRGQDLRSKEKGVNGDKLNDLDVSRSILLHAMSQLSFLPSLTTAGMSDRLVLDPHVLER